MVDDVQYMIHEASGQRGQNELYGLVVDEVQYMKSSQNELYGLVVDEVQYMKPVVRVVKMKCMVLW